jgi:two-component system OmpR family sensor kinase
MNTAPVPALGSLKTRIILLLVAAAAITAMSAGLLFYGLSTSQQLIDRAQAAQTRIEGYITLASRLNEYRTSTEAMLAAGGLNDNDKLRLRQQVDTVRQAFSRLLSLNVEEVDSARDTEKPRVASKGLFLSRMKAQFDSLHRTLNDLPAGEAGQVRGASALNAFGATISPMMVHSIETERQLTTVTHAEIAQLRQRLIWIALAVLGIALLAFAAIYFTTGRPLLRRIDETISGAEAIAGGELSRRLTPTGNDELTRLMTRFNTMADSLAGREADLRAAQADLQATVDRQTADLREVNRRLETIDANRRNFFADVSHELRTPLTVVQGEAEYNLNAKAKPKPAEMRQSFETILVRVRELRRRVDDMLRVARSESGKLDLHRSGADLEQVTADAVAGETATARRRNMKLVHKPSGHPLPVRGDQDWLRQIISGLIMNALKYATGSKQIEVRSFEDDGFGVVQVADQGPGIAPEDLQTVFDRFVQSNSTTGGDGFGIGLHLAKWVVDEHGGNIAMHNNDPGPGLTVTVRIPLAANRDQGGTSQ